MNLISNCGFIIVFAALLGTFIVPSTAQDNPQDYVSAHNQARAQVGVGQIQWDENVAAYARSYVEKLRGDCTLIHSGGPYGENLAGGGGTGDFSGVDAVNLWVGEKANYNHDSNSCINGECLHYTQVVWSNSVRLGCAKVMCNGGAIISCNYDPPGNYANQKPY